MELEYHQNFKATFRQIIPLIMYHDFQLNLKITAWMKLEVCGKKNVALSSDDGTLV